MSSASDHPFGTDTITDFTPGDRIAFDHAVFASFAAVQPQMVQVGADTVIVYNGGNTLTVQNTVAAALTGERLPLLLRRQQPVPARYTGCEPCEPRSAAIAWPH
jgi:hypothetical protein